MIAIDVIMYASVPIIANHHGRFGTSAYIVSLYARVATLAAIVVLLIYWDRKASSELEA